MVFKRTSSMTSSMAGSDRIMYMHSRQRKHTWCNICKNSVCAYSLGMKLSEHASNWLPNIELPGMAVHAVLV